MFKFGKVGRFSHTHIRHLQGILCDKSYDQDVDDKNPVTGVCIKKDGYSFGPRPLCWYKPSTAELTGDEQQ